MKLKPNSFKIIALFAIQLFFLFACVSSKNNNVLFDLRNEKFDFELISNSDDNRLKSRTFEQVPSIAASVDGKQIFVAWYSGGKAPGPGNYVTLSLSLDNGKNWLNDQLAVYPKDNTHRFFDPLLCRNNEGIINLFYGNSKNGLLWDGYGGVNSLQLNWIGNKIVASNPQRLANGVMSNKPIVLDPKRNIIFPIYVDKPLDNSNKSFLLPQNGVFLYSSSSVNKKLKLYSSIFIEDSLRIHDEPQVVQVSNNGNLLAMLRTTQGIFYTKSTDFGKSWDSLKPFTGIGPTTSSRFYLGKLSSGNLLLITNSSKTRNNMAAFLSKDGGKTWPYKLLLDARENVSYPDADQTIDGNIHVVFDRERTGAKDILYVRFTEKDLISGNIDAIFKTRVNK